MNEYLERELIKLEDMIGYFTSRIISYPLVPPEHVYFSLTNRCCLRCIMCDIPKSPGRQEDELKTDEIKKIILQIKDLGVKHLIFSGGEPLLRDDLLELVRFSKKNGIPWVDIITNGVLCDDRMALELVKSGLNHITFSLDGTAKVNDIVRGQGSFNKSADAIDKINYYKDKLKTRHPSVGINFTILSKNVGDMLEIVKFAKSKNCNTLLFQPVLVSNVSMDERRKHSLWPSGKDLASLEKNIASLVSMKEKEQDSFIYTDMSILKNIPNHFKGKRPAGNFKCYEGIKRIVITCDGKLWSCKGIYGDLRRDNLKEIWFSEDVQKIRNSVNKCRDHCLQDCVYFPMDLSGLIKRFISGINDEQNNDDVRKRLVTRINYCVSELSGYARSNLLSFIRVKKQIDSLGVIKKYLLR